VSTNPAKPPPTVIVMSVKRSQVFIKSRFTLG
jgi:hypothetical protein